MGSESLCFIPKPMFVQASHVAIYLTILFAYISVAYVAGNKLTKLQLALATFIFVAASAREVFNIAVLGKAIFDLQAELALINPSGISSSAEETPALFSIWWSLGVWSLGAIAALIFMWSIRQSKKN